MMPDAWDAASIAVRIVLFLLVVWSLNELISAYLARHRFARLLALRRFWLRNRSCQTSAALSISGKSL